MEGVKSVFGIALFVAAFYYLKNVWPALAALTGRTPQFLAAAVVVALAGVAAGAVHLSFHDTRARRLRKGIGVALTVAGLFAVTNYVLTPKRELAWHKSEPAALAAARASGQHIVIDFWATWCLPCKELEVNVFSHPKVAERLAAFTLLKVDLTNDDDALEAIKARYGVATLPAVRVVAPNGQVVAKTDELVDVEEFLGLLAAAPGS